jgi:pimeloyl-ACP methyl ester carboxylesterase
MSKQPLLLLHGALASSAQLEGLKQKLAADFDVHTLNLPGHGGSNIPDVDFNFALFADSILSYLDSNQLKQVSIFGYSMGGYAALYLAARYPDRVNKIMTLGTKFDWTPESSAKEVKMLDPEKIELKVPAFAAQLHKVHHPQNWKTVLKKTAQMMLNLGQQPELTEDDLKGIQQKVLVSIGDKDTMAGLTGTVQAYQQLPNASLWVIPDTGHPFEKVALPELARGIRSFFVN